MASGQKYPPNSSLRTGYRFMFFIWALMGLAYISNLISAIQNDMSETFDIIGKKLCCKKEDQKKSPIEHIDIKKEDGHESIIPPMLVK